MHNAARCLYCLCFAIQLVSEPLNIIQSIRNHDIIPGEYSLHGRVFFCPGILLSLRGVVDVAGESQSLVVDMMEPQSVDTRVSGTEDG